MKPRWTNVPPDQDHAGGRRPGQVWTTAQGYYAGKEFSKFTTVDKERQLEDALMLGDPITELDDRDGSELLPA